MDGNRDTPGRKLHFFSFFGRSGENGRKFHVLYGKIAVLLTKNIGEQQKSKLMNDNSVLFDKNIC